MGVVYNCIGIPLAAGVFINVFGWQLSPMLGAAAMSLSSFCVVANALRLNFFKIYDNRKDGKIKHKEKQKMDITTTLKIEGMMCPHCEARVKSVLEGIDGVISANVNYQNGNAIVVTKKEIYETLKLEVEQAGYKIIEKDVLK